MAKKKVEKAPNHERWLLTYADMITLLMIFFIVLWSMSTADSEKWQKISAALQRAFSLELFESGGSGGQPSSSGPAVIDAKLVAFAAIKSQIGVLAKNNDVINDVDVRLDREGVVITLSGNFLFESGRADIRPDAVPLLDGIAAYLRLLPNEVRVSGHTDNVPIETPLYASNWELSSARAIAVVKYLTAAGITAERLGAVGFGEFRPLVPNDTRANRAKNRRAELLILFPEGPPGAPGRLVSADALPHAAGAAKEIHP
jgi:chemotaxis protein MotB